MSIVERHQQPKKAHLYSSWEGTHKSRIFCVELWWANEWLHTKGFNSYKLSLSTSDSNNKKREWRKLFPVPSSTMDESHIMTHISPSLSSLHTLILLVFPFYSHAGAFRMWKIFFALFVNEDDLLEWLWHVVIIMKKPHAISTLRFREYHSS